MANLINDDQKHKDVESIEEQDAKSVLGSESADVENIDEIDESMGIYGNSSNTGSDTDEVDIAAEIAKHNEG